MRHLLTIAATLLLVAFATTALADRGNGPRGHDKYVSKGEKVQRHLDRKGDRIEHRFDHKADRADAKGKYRQADHFRAQGERINRHLDHKGDRFRDRYDRHARYDRHFHHNHYDRHHHHDARSHRHHVEKRIVHREYRPYIGGYGVVISHPDLWFSGWWR